MKAQQFNYFKAKMNQPVNEITFENLDEMCRFAELNQIHNILLISIADNDKQYFALYHNACIFTHETMGYQTLENYSIATDKGFPNATVYYDAIEKGYTKYSDYILVKEAGIADITTFEIMKKKGFVSGYIEYKNLIEQQPDLLNISTAFNNPYELYCYAKQNHFEDCTELLVAFSKGFADATMYKTATNLGYPTYQDYIEANEKRFRSYQELIVARNKNIRDSDDFSKYADLEVLRKNGESHDQLLLLLLLSKIEQGKRASLNKLSIGLLNAVKEYCYLDNNEMPAWFNTHLKNSNDVAEFLQKNMQVKKYGNYDVDGEFFEINQMRDRAVVLDASNIAHNSNVNIDKKVLAGNIVILIDFLKQNGFEDITVIADASLRHKIADADMYDKLQKDAVLLVAPKETSADLFIINYVKKHHCLVVSNDTFREWKVLDAWVADNIDFYRLSFLIKGNEVLMPDLK